MVIAVSCGTSKNTPVSRSVDYTPEEVQIVGYGHGESPDFSTARGIAMTEALGDLSRRLDVMVRTADSNYKNQKDESYKAMFESIVEAVSENRLYNVTYKGDKKPSGSKRNQYVFDVEAKVDMTVFKKNIEAIFDEFEATADERDAFRREMFGNNL